MNEQPTIVGAFGYRDITCSQHPDVGIPFKSLFESIKPKRILEIGTAWGGLTLLLNDILIDCGLNDTKILTYDIIELNRNHFKGCNIDYREENIFNNTKTDLIDFSVVDFIKSDGPTIVLCDGGAKKNEFNIFADHLKVGDIIMAHDYSPTLEYFHEHMKDKIWNWCEINQYDILEAVEKNNLEPFMQDDFIKVAWVCKIKK